MTDTPNEYATRITYNGRTLEVTTDMVNTGPYVEADPNWITRDKNGHEHMAVTDPFEPVDGVSYPTLELKTGPAKWCTGCREEHPDSWWACTTCGETVRPGLRDGRERWTQGLTTFKIDGVEVDPDQAREFAMAWQRDLDYEINFGGLR